MATFRSLLILLPALGVMLAGAVGNTGFFGLPLIAASGDGFSLAAAVMYDTLGTGLITWTSTVAVASGFGGERGGGREVARALRGLGKLRKARLAKLSSL